MAAETAAWMTTSGRIATLAALLLGSAPTLTGAATSPATCERAVEGSLRRCIAATSSAFARCYRATGRECPATEPSLVSALGRVAVVLEKRCGSDAIVRAAGFGSAATVASLATRLRETCRAETASLSARSFGGPQGASLAAATNDGERSCLRLAHRLGTRLLTRAVRNQGRCILAQRRGGGCDTARLAASLSALENRTIEGLERACPAPRRLEQLVTLTPAQFARRALEQAECAVAQSHPDPAPLALACGPRAAVPPLPRGVYTQVTLDESTFGTRCGDGSPLSFWIRPAPAGHPIENVVVALQGGGVCIFEGDCAAASPDLFESLSDLPPTAGIMSNNPAISPLANFTKVFIPYCTQDVFIGGGTTSVWPSVTVHRFGSINTRAVLRYLRDLVWRELNASDAEGYHPARMRVLFGGFSAGAFGTLYNYHYLLDDLQWRRTTAFPDAGLALDNGSPLGIRSLAALVIPPTPPLGWGAGPYLPPYCFAGNCALGPVLLAATAPRLAEVPEQQFMILSNQVDSSQVSTTYFPDTPTWVNTMRQAYCDTAGLPGVNYYLSPISTSIHVISLDNARFTTLAVDGQTMQDWFTTLLASPSAVTDQVQEGSLTTDIPGVLPFPCPVAP